MDAITLDDYKDPRIHGKPMITEQQRKELIYALLLIVGFMLLLGLAGKSDNDSRIIMDKTGNVITAGAR